MTIKEQIKNYLATNILFSDNGFPYPDDVSFSEQNIVDSLSNIELVDFIEKTYGFTVLDTELVPENFDSVVNLTNYVSSKMA
jgi:acyl carrier protein